MAEETWRDAEAYAYQRELSLGGLAWEFLRRNPAYRAKFDSTAQVDVADELCDQAEGWGLSFPADPALAADRQPIFWRPEVYPRAITLEPMTADADAPLVFDPATWPGQVDQRLGAGGAHYLLRIGVEEHQLWVPEPLCPGGGMAIVQPVDRHFMIRLEAAGRFFRRLSKPHRAAPPARGDPLFRRLTLMLRALDGRAAGASQRLIAEAVLGARCASPRQWEDSAARAMTARLLRSGAALVAGAYLQLLYRGFRP